MDLVGYIYIYVCMYNNYNYKQISREFESEWREEIKGLTKNGGNDINSIPIYEILEINNLLQ